WRQGPDWPRWRGGLFLALPPSVAGLQVHHVGERFSSKIAPQVLENEGHFPVPKTRRDGADVRSDQNPGMTPQLVIGWQGLGGEHVERRAPEPAAVQGVQKGPFVQNPAP